jgi:hypothetical protein
VRYAHWKVRKQFLFKFGVMWYSHCSCDARNFITILKPKLLADSIISVIICGQCLIMQ